MKRRKEEKKITISFCIDKDIAESINKLSNDLSLSKSYIIQKALVKYLAQGKKVQNTPA
jgi:predicted transcriptional regulator